METAPWLCWNLQMYVSLVHSLSLWKHMPLRHSKYASYQLLAILNSFDKKRGLTDCYWFVFIGVLLASPEAQRRNSLEKQLEKLDVDMSSLSKISALADTLTIAHIVSYLFLFWDIILFFSHVIIYDKGKMSVDGIAYPNFLFICTRNSINHKFKLESW